MLLQERNVPLDFAVSIIPTSGIYTDTKISYSVRHDDNSIWITDQYRYRSIIYIVAFVKNFIYDDYKSLYIIYEKLLPRYLVHDEDTMEFLYDILKDRCVNVALIRKNKPKIKSSKYGAQLCDIDVTCIEN